MLALSIRQPWCWLILHAGKDVENRSWTPRNPALLAAERLARQYHQPGGGWFLIHASSGMTRAEYDDAIEFAEEVEWTQERHPKGFRWPKREELFRGGIVGCARLKSVFGEIHTPYSPWFAGPIGLLLTDATPLPFYAVKGALGFFDVPHIVLPAHPATTAPGA